MCVECQVKVGDIIYPDKGGAVKKSILFVVAFASLVSAQSFFGTWATSSNDAAASFVITFKQDSTYTMRIASVETFAQTYKAGRRITTVLDLSEWITTGEFHSVDVNEVELHCLSSVYNSSAGLSKDCSSNEFCALRKVNGRWRLGVFGSEDTDQKTSLSFPFRKVR